MKRNLFSSILFDASDDKKQTPPTKITPGDDGFVSGKKWAYRLNPDTKRHTIWLYGVFKSTNDYRDILSLFHRLNDDDVVVIHVHSLGGNITAASNIISAMLRSRATIITNNIGTAASCGSLITSFGHKIHVDPNTTTMFHHAAFGFQDSVHRMLSYSQHAINQGVDLLTKMQKRGIITEDEVYAISQRGEEFYLSSEIMESRLRAANLWYEGEL